jgi:hypothetical protein
MALSATLKELIHFHFEMKVDTYHQIDFVRREKLFALRVAEYQRDQKINQTEIDYLISHPVNYVEIFDRPDNGHGHFKTYLDRSMLITAQNKLQFPVLLSNLIAELSYAPGGSQMDDAQRHFEQIVKQ